jgi:hypothetical protein
VDGLPPAPRGGHALASLDSRVLLFGGADRNPSVFDDLWLLETGAPRRAAGIARPRRRRAAERAERCSALCTLFQRSPASTRWASPRRAATGRCGCALRDVCGARPLLRARRAACRVAGRRAPPPSPGPRTLLSAPTPAASPRLPAPRSEQQI